MSAARRPPSFMNKDLIEWKGLQSMRILPQYSSLFFRFHLFGLRGKLTMEASTSMLECIVCYGTIAAYRTHTYIKFLEGRWHHIKVLTRYRIVSISLLSDTLHTIKFRHFLIVTVTEYARLGWFLRKRGRFIISRVFDARKEYLICIKNYYGLLWYRERRKEGPLPASPPILQRCLLLLAGHGWIQRGKIESYVFREGCKDGP